MCHHCYERDREDHGGHNRCCHCGQDRGPAQEMPYHESPLEKIHQLEDKVKLWSDIAAKKSLETQELLQSIEIRERNAGELTFQLRDANRVKEKALAKNHELAESVSELDARLAEAHAEVRRLESELGERFKTIERLGIQLADLAMKARAVMGDLEKHGPSIVPHLLDTDDNDGQYLRVAVERVLGKT